MAALLAAFAGCHRGTKQSPAVTEPSTSAVAAYGEGDVPTLWVDGKPAAPTSLFVYNQDADGTPVYGTSAWLDAFRGYVDQAKSAGFTYVSFGVYLRSTMFATKTEPAQIGSDLDLTQMDSLFEYAEQQGVYLLPNLWVDDPPEWWASAHQDEMQHSSDDPPAIDPTASFDNPAYWLVMDEYVKAIVNHYKTHPALLGWSPAVGVTRENNYGPSYVYSPNATGWSDYSPFAEDRFRAWLASKYVNDGALQSAWNDAMVTLTTATPPLPLSPVLTPTADVANGAGDTRPQMRDWLAFRLDEKGAEWKHFTDLVKGLDPDHVVAMNPANAELVSSYAMARSGSADGLEWTRYANVDIVRIHPRISYNDVPGPYNTNNDLLFSFVAQARHAGKLATFAFEDTGDMQNGGADIDSIDRIDALVPMLATAGGGAGWVVGVTSGTVKMPVWSSTELAEVAKFDSEFAPSTRTVTIPKIAILLDPRNDQLEYPLGGMLGTSSRFADRASFYASLFANGVRIDPIGVEEVRDDASVLSRYAGILVGDLARLPVDIAGALSSYEQSGGGLFVAGRTGIFDQDGATDYSALETLLGLSASPTCDATTYGAWSFDSSDDPLLQGVASQPADTANPFYIPIADWPGIGFSALGHAASVGGVAPAVLMARANGKTVLWLPRLAATGAVTVFQNWMTAVGAR